MNYIKLLREYIDTFINFIYPRNIYCILCNTPIDRDEGYSLCLDCKNKLKFIKERACNECGKPLDELYLIERCPECIANPNYYTKAISCIEYDDLSKKIIYNLKYYKKRYISYHIAEIIYDRLTESNINNLDIIIPVPLYKDKERERSFNQASIIGKYLKDMIELDIDNKTLIRLKNTTTQNQLTKEERRTNLEGAFKLTNRDRIKDKNILLIDDIHTTGSTETVDSCISFLKKHSFLECFC